MINKKVRFALMVKGTRDLLTKDGGRTTDVNKAFAMMSAESLREYARGMNHELTYPEDLDVVWIELD